MANREGFTSGLILGATLGGIVGGVLGLSSPRDYLRITPKALIP
ncbi:hypothetical protein [Limnospira platensis]|nr:hypothetical protein APLC1_4691 [Arthrospira platensis C1]